MAFRTIVRVLVLVRELSVGPTDMGVRHKNVNNNNNNNNNNTLFQLAELRP